MKTEIIEHHNKKIIKKIKNNGDISYSLKGAYLGIDNKTGKQVTTTFIILARHNTNSFHI